MRRATAGLLAGLAMLAPAGAGIIGRDDRVPVASLAASADADDRALAVAAGAVGLLRCDNGRIASAVLVGERTAVTSAHVFVDVLSNVRAGRVACRFGLPSGSVVDVDLAALRLGIERPVTGHNICSNTRDWAVLRLAAAPTGARPLSTAASAPTPGTPAAIVTAVARGGPSAGRCAIRDLARCAQTNASLVFTDCDAEPGSSGGATLVRVDGRWVLGAVTRGASPTGGPAYDRASVYHMAVPTAGPLRAAIGGAAPLRP